jgi:hypothetical protein
MTIDLKNETILSLHEAAKYFPSSRQGRPTHVSSVLRRRRPDKNGVALEMWRLGGRWVTSVEAIQRYSAALTATLTEQPSAVGPRRGQSTNPTPATVSPARRKHLANVEAELTARGVRV